MHRLVATLLLASLTALELTSLADAQSSMASLPPSAASPSSSAGAPVITAGPLAGSWPAPGVTAKFPATTDANYADWNNDFNLIVFGANDSAPVVPTASVGKANSNFCDWSFNLCILPSDISTCSAPLQWGLNFDDGPIAPQTQTLLTFLKQNNQKATHFMIGGNMYNRPDLVLQAYQQGDQIAVHTWSHQAMTTLDSKTAYAELRYTRDIVKAITGVTPLFWRPPFGDVDNRIRTIATHLNLVTTLWNLDTNDWCIGDTSPGDAATCSGFQAASVHTNLENWATNQTTNPMGMVILEHELNPGAVDEFIIAYPVIAAMNPKWNILTVADCNNRPAYAEQMNSTSTMTAQLPPTTGGRTATNPVVVATVFVNPGAVTASGSGLKAISSLTFVLIAVVTGWLL